MPMSIREFHLKNRNGIYNTPSLIADLLVGKLVITKNISIIDPACGKGNLLMAALQLCKELSSKEGPYLVGCDKFKQRNIDERIKFVHKDFFRYVENEKFDIVLTNPPYIHSSNIEVKA